jgi:hypothetical protein
MQVETGQLEEIIVDTHMPAFLKVFQFKFEEQTPGVRKSVYETHAPKNPDQFHRRNDSNDRKKTSIWNFDDFLSVQNELMLKPDLVDSSAETINIEDILNQARSGSMDLQKPA